MGGEDQNAAGRRPLLRSEGWSCWQRSMRVSKTDEFLLPLTKSQATGHSGHRERPALSAGVRCAVSYDIADPIIGAGPDAGVW